MPLASDGKRLFPVENTNSYGRVMIERQREIHDDLIGRAPTVVSDKVLPIYMRQMQVLHKAERFKPSYNQMKQRQDDDIVMTNLIRDAKCTSINQLDGHILRFRELRQKHPNFIPGWLKRYEDGKSMEVHDQIIKKSRKWIDDEPPVRALNYRSVLQKTPFTRGGFPRIISTVPRRKRRRGKKGSGSSLPPRRSASSKSHNRPMGSTGRSSQGCSSQGNTPKSSQGNTRTHTAESRHSNAFPAASPTDLYEDQAASSQGEPQHDEAGSTEGDVQGKAQSEDRGEAAAEESKDEEPQAAPLTEKEDVHNDEGSSEQQAEPNASEDDLIDPDFAAAAEEEPRSYEDEWDSDAEADDQSNNGSERSPSNRSQSPDQQ